MAAVAGGNGIVVFFFFDQQARFFQIFDGFFAAGVTVHAQVFFGAVNHFAFVVDDGHHRQVVPLAHFIVRGVVRRRNFQRAGAEFHFHGFVGNDGYGAVCQRDNDFFAH